MTTKKLTKLLALYLPYILLGLGATNIGEAWRLAEGKELGDKIMAMMGAVPVAFANPLPSFMLLVGLWITLTFFCRSSARSDSVTHTQWAAAHGTSNTPRSFIH